jgi:hypothetical protein
MAIIHSQTNPSTIIRQYLKEDISMLQKSGHFYLALTRVVNWQKWFYLIYVVIFAFCSAEVLAK